MVKLVEINQGLMYGLVAEKFSFVITNIGSELQSLNPDGSLKEIIKVEDPWAGMLCVPKDTPHESPSLNKHSPTIAKGKSLNEVVEKLEKWIKENPNASPYDLRDIC